MNKKQVIKVFAIILAVIVLTACGFVTLFLNTNQKFETVVISDGIEFKFTANKTKFLRPFMDRNNPFDVHTTVTYVGNGGEIILDSRHNTNLYDSDGNVVGMREANTLEGSHGVPYKKDVPVTTKWKGTREHVDEQTRTLVPKRGQYTLRLYVMYDINDDYNTKKIFMDIPIVII